MPRFFVKDVRIDTDAREVKAADGARPLEPKAFDALVLLIENRGRTLSKEELLAAIWPGQVVTDSVLTQAIAKCRKVLGDGGADLIKTVHRVGYRFDGAVSVGAGAVGQNIRVVVAVTDADADKLPEGVEVCDSAGQAVKRAVALQRDGCRGGIGIHAGAPADPSAGDSPEVPAPEAVARQLAAAGRPGQILLSATGFEMGRADPALGALPGLTWLAHGTYHFAELDTVVNLFEAGFPGASPMAQPPDRETIRRALADDVILGWRAAAGQTVPGRGHWELERRLGEGGFGEAWLAVHRKTHERRVFKFCYRADRLRSLQREVTLFRLLNETLGRRDDIAQILDWNFDDAPYFIESEYTGRGDIAQWADAHGGLDAIDLETRLDLFVQTARAVAAAHAVGVLHKDIKPGNILIQQSASAPPKAVLCDFGIGLITDVDSLDQHDITRLGVTDVVAGNVTTERSGTRRYMAPELLEGEPATIQADVYSLGIVLYQLVVGDFGRVLAPGWERDIPDALLRQDIAAMVDGDPGQRMGDAKLAAQRVETLAERRAEASRREAEARRLARLERRRKILVPLAAGATAIAVVVSIMALQIRTQAQRANEQSRVADQERRRAESTADFLTGLFDRANPYRYSGKDPSAKELLDIGRFSLEESPPEDPAVRGRILLTVAEAYLGLGAIEAMEATLAQFEGSADPQAARDLEARVLLLKGEAEALNDRFDASRELLNRALELSRTGADPETEIDALMALVKTESSARQAEAARDFASLAYEASLSHFGPDHAQTLTAKNMLALNLTYVNEFEAAEALFLELVDAVESTTESSFLATAVLNNYLQLLLQVGRIDEAAAYGQRALDLAQSNLPEGHHEIATIASNLGNALNYANRPEEAEDKLKLALEIRQGTLGKHSDTALSHTNLAGFYMRYERWDEAEAHALEALTLHRELLGDTYLTAVSLHDYASIVASQGRKEEAVPLMRESAGILERELGEEHWITGAIYGAYSQALTETGRVDEGIEQARRSIGVLEKVLPEGHFRRAAARAQLASAYLAKGDALAASNELEGQLEIVAEQIGADSAEYRLFEELNQKIQDALAESR